MQDKNINYKLILDKLAEVIKEERLKTNKSQRLLADEYSIQKSLLSRLENGLNEPKLISVLLICEALNIKASELFKKLEEKLPDGFSLIEN